jgi:hypothetical protein
MQFEQGNEMTISAGLPDSFGAAPGRHELQTGQADKAELLGAT